MKKDKPKVKVITSENIATSTEQEVEAFLEHLIQEAEKIRRKLQNTNSGNNQRAEVLIKYIQKYPELFMGNIEYIERDMLKWALRKHIDTMQALLAAIQECEDELGLPIIHKY